MANIPFLNNAYFSAKVGIGTETNSAEETNNGIPRLQVTTATAVLGEFPLAARFTTASDAGDNSGVSVLINSGNDRGLMISAGRAESNRARATLNLVQYDGNELVDGITLYQPNTASGGATTGTNVGIGTASPNATLHLSGISQTGSKDAFRIENDTSNTKFQIKSVSGDYNLQFKNAGNVTRVFLNSNGDSYLTGGNVGIGTDSPDYNLEIENASSPTIATKDTTNNVITKMFSANSQGFIGTESNHDLRVRTNNTDKITIQSGGNVGIGTTSPNSKLTVWDVGQTFDARTSGINVHRPNSYGQYGSFSYDGATTHFASTYTGNAAVGYGTFVFKQYNNGTVGRNALEIQNDGNFLFNQYAGSALTGTPTYLLGTDSSGNVVKTNTVPGSAAGPYLPLAGGTMTGVAGVVFPDVFKLNLGTGSDLQISHDGFDSYINNFTGNLNIVNLADDKDIIFQSDNGSGGVATYFYLDGSLGLNRFLEDTLHNDDVVAKFGTGSDLRIQHTGNQSYIQNYTGDLQIQNVATDKDILFRADDGNGVVTSYLVLDGSTTHAYFSNPGNVGIGATSPNYKLAVYGSSEDSEIVASFGSGNDQNEYTAIGLSGFIASNGATKAGIALKRTGVYGTGELHFLNNNTLDNSDITLSDSKMMIDDTGNVGIGTTSPGYKLTIEGDVAVQDAQNLWLRGGRVGFENVALNNAAYIYNIGATGSSKLNIADSLYVIEAGNVGIGTADPARLLHVNSSGQTDIHLTSSDQGTASTDGMTVFLDSSGSGGLWLREAQALRFATSSSERMRIDSSGNVMIGNTNASAKLDIRQDTGYAFRTENASGSTFRVEADTGNIEAAGSVKMADDTATASATKVGTMRYRTGTEYVEVTGVDLVTNGDFATDSDWTKGTGWTISGGTASAVSATGELSQTGINFDTSKIYRVGYVISGYSGSGGVKARLKGAVWNTGILREGNGSFTETITSTGENFVFAFVTSSSFTGSIDNVSVMEVTAEDASYADMCMQTGASTYEWVNIVRNTY